MSALPFLAATPAVFDTRPVLESAPLRDGFDRDQLSRVGDMHWDLSPAVFRNNVQRCACYANFTLVEEPSAIPALKAFLYLRLNHPAIALRRRCPPSGLHLLFTYARRFLVFVTKELGACDLNRVHQSLLDAYLDHLKRARRAKGQIARHLDIAADFHLFAPLLPGGGLTFAPWRGRSVYDIAGAPHKHRATGENTTPRIPEAVIEPLLAWSIKYVKLFARDIFAARAEWERIQHRARRITAAEAGLPTIFMGRRRRARIRAFINERIQAGRGIPTYTRRVAGRYAWRRSNGEPLINWILIERMTACTQFRDFHQQEIREAAAATSFEIGGMDTPISNDPDTGCPWRERFDPDSLALEERMLETAAYVICAYLTGMRDCEVQAMRAGCCSVERSEDGLVQRYRVRSKVFKGAPAGPEDANWVAIAPVADAITLMERLTRRLRRRDGNDGLWRNLHKAPEQALPHIAYNIVFMLNRFRDHLNAQFGSPETPIIPSGPDGRSWRFTTRQFRRTIAWHIANRPFGAVAGMIQYKHASIAAFEGYAGSSRSGFRAEIAREHAFGQMEDIISYFEARQDGLTISGPASARVSKALDAAAADLDPLPGMIADRGRLRALLKDLARTLHVGPLADCFFDPARALCLKRATDLDSDRPALALCEPTRCPNACFTSRHRPVWAKARDDARTLLREKRLSQAQRTTLETDAARYERVITSIDEHA